MEDYYRTLGISPSSSHEEVRRAYRVLARRYHPDVNPGNTSEDVFKRVAEAYAVLSDADRRRSYDDEVRLIRARSKGAGADAYSQAGRSRKSPPPTSRGHQSPKDGRAADLPCGAIGTQSNTSHLSSTLRASSTAAAQDSHG